MTSEISLKGTVSFHQKSEWALFSAALH